MAPGQCSVESRAVGHQPCLGPAGTVPGHSSNLSCGSCPAGGVLQMARPAQQHRSHEPGSRDGDAVSGVLELGVRCRTASV